MKLTQFSAITIALATCMFASCSKQQQQQQQMPAANYKTMTVKAEDRQLQNSYSATIRGRQDIEIYPQIAGKLTRLCVTEGQVVRAGQPLFIIDQIPYRAALMTAVSNVRAAQAAVATAKLTFDSKSKLYASKVVSAFDVQTAKNAWLTAIAQLGQARAQEISARNNLSYTVVKSPSAGVVGTLPYRVGALVSASLQQPLTTVSDNSQMYVYFSISENQLLDYTQQYGSMEQAIKAFPLVKLMLNNGTEYSQPGKIESISGVIDTQTGTATVRAVFPNKGRLLHSGASGNVVVPYTYKHCIVIPQTATTQMQDKTLVYKVVNGKATSCIVTVAPYNNGQEYVVTDGLKPGDVIIAEGAGLVREGTPVK
jgi:membrane fusion protein (multidrug efflux system)